MQEFKIINQLLKPLAGKDSAGLNDDCAFFNGYCITKDILIAGVHFFETDAPYNLARKALRVNLSDLASCGAEPFGFMLGLALPKGTNETWLTEFTSGLQADIKEFNFQMLGGDTVYHDGKLTISVTALGQTPKPITRTGAKIGDNIFVSGVIGAGYLGLKSKISNQQSAITKSYDLPQPRISLGLKLRSIATSCIDISDGLLADLNHICENSNVGAELISSQIPLADSQADLMDQITGGDDYELLFTSLQTNIENCHKIGKITAGKGILLDGIKTKPRGYEHGQ